MLKDILDDILAEDGIKSTDTGERNLAVKRINDAAKEIYDMGDLYGFIDQEVFDLNVGTQQVALPEYVGFVRGMRYYDRRLGISIEHIGNRYKSGCATENWYLKFTELRWSPLARQIDNQSVLVLSVPLAESEAFNVYLQGPTDNAARARETVAFAAGNLIKETVKNFRSPMFSIKKDKITSYDVTIKDVEDNILAIIPNNQLVSRFHIYQIMDSEYVNPGAEGYAVETLFKKRFVPFKNDEDEFVGGPDYDKAIVWKYLEHRAPKSEDAIGFRAKCLEVINNINEDVDNGKRKRMDFVPGPYFQKQYLKYGS